MGLRWVWIDQIKQKGNSDIHNTGRVSCWGSGARRSTWIDSESNTTDTPPDTVKQRLVSGKESIRTGSRGIDTEKRSKDSDYTKMTSGKLIDESQMRYHDSICSKTSRRLPHYKEERRGTNFSHSSLIHRFQILFFQASSLSYSEAVLIRSEQMSQGVLIGDKGSQVGQTGMEKKVAISLKRMKITVPKFDNSSLIEGYSRTLIGRCMNPHLQDMKALLYMLPRIWKVEDRVAGADLGMGKFQFMFDKEEDVLEVMKMEPFHFDYWMLSLVRWAPIIDPSYPSMIKFWIRIIGVPLHYWADVTFRSIGKALGKVEEVNVDDGKVQVIIDGLKPLCFETTVEFDGGEETTVFLRYERLFGFCRICHSLCHDQLRCPTRVSSDGRRTWEDQPDEEQNGKSPASYRTATTHGVNKELGGNFKRNGKSHTVVEDRRQHKERTERRSGEGSSRVFRPHGYIPPREFQKRPSRSKSLVFESHGNRSLESNVQVPKEIPGEQHLVQEDKQEEHLVSVEPRCEKSARKSLDFEEEETTGVADALLRKEMEAPVSETVNKEPEGKTENHNAIQEFLQQVNSGLETGELQLNLDAEFGGMDQEEGEFVGNENGALPMVQDGSEQGHINEGDIQMAEENDVFDEGSKQGTKKKATKINSKFLGGGSKKRMVQALISPRKKQVAKVINRNGDGSSQGAPKGPSNPREGRKLETSINK
ncbi:hypothetical protein EUTSA_v10002827mg [Eutrema salsugineum]|uniref:DUF4283 domain-containing protein n=1 Tax=Eutrema salsugineum TaxID=72664 RepID=V4L3L2_EUTSA|nr:hypothetical protein EUTSA_v10002827mg [Eutrema salsugineum]